MRNPLGWVLGYAWMLFVKIHMKRNPTGGSMWLPRWIQPYWMRCMGWEVNEGVIEFYRRKS